MTETASRGASPGRTRGTPCWASLMVHRLSAVQDFYRALFGWEFAPGPQQLGPCVRGTLHGHAVAGLGELTQGRPARVSWTPYLASDDVDATANRIRERGGTVAVGPMDAEAEGRIALAADPGGAPFGIWQAGGHHDASAADPGEPGTPVWFELVCHKTDEVSSFYAEVFDCRTAAGRSAANDRTRLLVDGRSVAELCGVGAAIPRDRGPHWRTYFAVADLGAALRQVADLGGQTEEPPYETTLGRAGTASDPQGAQFSLLEEGARGT